jgi:hypothetical protein
MEEHYKLRLRDFKPRRGLDEYIQRTKHIDTEPERSKVGNYFVLLAMYNSFLIIGTLAVAALGLEKLVPKILEKF